MKQTSFFHSVTLNRDRCFGCINCVKRCPTEAIRVRDGKAFILIERCIDCGECIRICPHQAKRAIFDRLDIMDDFTYTIALPAPALFGQFNNLDNPNLVVGALELMGFDSVFEVARAAELVTNATQRYMRTHKQPRPIISSACPAVLRLIRVRFPELLPNVLPLHAPFEIAARMAKNEAAKQTGLAMNEIGAIFISPCPAKVTAVKMPLGTQKSWVDGVIAIRDVYPRLIDLMREVPADASLTRSGRAGFGWGSRGGEALAAQETRYLAADGIENVIGVLEELEDQRFYDLDFIELNACPGGCVGGVLNIENPFVAVAKLDRVRRERPASCNSIHGGGYGYFEWDTPVEYEPVLELDADVKTAMEKMKRIQEIHARLCGKDCGSCGAPSCKAMAEDIVQGFATEDSCIYKLRDSIDDLTLSLRRWAEHMPGSRTQDIAGDEGEGKK